MRFLKINGSNRRFFITNEYFYRLFNNYFFIKPKFTCWTFRLIFFKFTQSYFLLTDDCIQNAKILLQILTLKMVIELFNEKKIPPITTSNSPIVNMKTLSVDPVFNTTDPKHHQSSNDFMDSRIQTRSPHRINPLEPLIYWHPML